MTASSWRRAAWEISDEELSDLIARETAQAMFRNDQVTE